MSLSPRLVVSCGLLAGIISGCASGKGTTPAPAADVFPGKPTAGRIITSEEIDRAPAESFERTLAAKVPGLIVSRASDGSLVLRIRTSNSIMANTEPLVIVDGTPTLSGPSGGLNGLNPRDIASIEVIKDASSLAMYGVRGANGVIVVKTKAAASQ